MKGFRSTIIIGVFIFLAWQTATLAQSFITNGLVAYYPFNGSANDASGNGNDGVVNGCTLVSDRFGIPNRAYSFNGIDNYISVGNALTAGAPFTWSVWFQPGISQTNVQQAILDQGGSPGAGQVSPVLGISWNDPANDGKFTFFTYDNATYYNDSNFRSQFDTNHWYHLVTTLDALGNSRLYVDGHLEGTLTGQAFGQNLSEFYIGGDVSLENAFFTGVINDVRIYDRALSSNEVANLYAIESAPPPPSTAYALATIVNGFCVYATVTNNGYGYTNTPAVRFIGGGGSGASGTAVVSNGFVVAVNMIWAGSDYTNPPLVVIQPPFIPNPALSLSRLSILTFSNLTIGANYQLQQPMGWYWTNLPVSFTASNSIFTLPVVGATSAQAYRLATNPVPVQAFATAQVANGFVVGATVISNGTGYVTAPAVTIKGTRGTIATAVASITNGAVSGISIVNPGSGYTNTVIEIAPPPVVAVFPSVSPGMRLDSANLSPYDNYQILYTPKLAAPWQTNYGIFTPTDLTNSQFLSITNNVGFIRAQHLP